MPRARIPRALLAAALRPLAPCNERLGLWARNAAAALLAVMTMMILLQVFYRYALNYSFAWTEELAKILMVWSAFLVAPWAYRTGANVSIALFVDALPRGFRLLLQIALNGLVLCVMLLFLREAVDFWWRGFAVTSVSMPVRMGWFYTVVPLGFIGIILAGVELILRDLLSLLDPQGDYRVSAPAAPREGE